MNRHTRAQRVQPKIAAESQTYLACVPRRVERTPATELERIVPRRQSCSSQKGGAAVGKTRRGKGTKWMVVVDGADVPLGDYLHSASPAEVTLAETTLATIRLARRHHPGRPRQRPERVSRRRLRQRLVAGAAGPARNPTDRAASLESQEASDARRPSPAAVSAALDRRAHHRLAGEFPALGRAL